MEKKVKTKYKQQKQKKREKEIRRQVNMRRNNTIQKNYVLEVFVDEKWQTAMLFSTEKEVKDYVDSIEKIRERGDTEIVEGRIIHKPSKKLIDSIPPFQPESK